MPRIDKRITTALFRKISRDPKFMEFDKWFALFSKAQKIRSKRQWIKQGHKCFYCKRDTIEERRHPMSYTIDHVVPLSCGGTENPGNIVSSCHVCNSLKGSMTQEEFLKIVYDEESFYSVWNKIQTEKRLKAEKKIKDLEEGNLSESQARLCYVISLLDMNRYISLKDINIQIENYLKECEKGKYARRRAKRILKEHWEQSSLKAAA